LAVPCTPSADRADNCGKHCLMPAAVAASASELGGAAFACGVSTPWANTPQAGNSKPISVAVRTIDKLGLPVEHGDRVAIEMNIGLALGVKPAQESVGGTSISVKMDIVLGEGAL